MTRKDIMYEAINTLCDRCKQYEDSCQTDLERWRARPDGLPPDVEGRMGQFMDRITNLKSDFSEIQTRLKDLEERLPHEIDAARIEQLAEYLGRLSSRAYSAQTAYNTLAEQAKNYEPEARRKTKAHRKAQKRQSSVWKFLMKPMNQTWLGSLFKD